MIRRLEQTGSRREVARGAEALMEGVWQEADRSGSLGALTRVARAVPGASLERAVELYRSARRKLLATSAWDWSWAELRLVVELARQGREAILAERMQRSDPRWGQARERELEQLVTCCADLPVADEPPLARRRNGPSLLPRGVPDGLPPEVGAGEHRLVTAWMPRLSAVWRSLTLWRGDARDVMGEVALFSAEEQGRRVRLWLTPLLGTEVAVVHGEGRARRVVDAPGLDQVCALLRVEARKVLGGLSASQL